MHEIYVCKNALTAVVYGQKSNNFPFHYVRWARRALKKICRGICLLFLFFTANLTWRHYNDVYHRGVCHTIVSRSRRKSITRSIVDAKRGSSKFVGRLHRTRQSNCFGVCWNASSHRNWTVLTIIARPLSTTNTAVPYTVRLGLRWPRLKNR